MARKPAAAAHVTEVYLELGTKRVFACAYEFPGLCRSARYEDMALAALVSAVPRYATVAKTAGSPPPTDALEVIERVAGSVSTDFGVPGTITSRDREPLTAAETRRVLALVAAAWTILDHTAAGAPQELTKGPRGGGRDRDKIVDHVLGAEVGYVAQLGVRGRKQPLLNDKNGVAGHRAAILEALAGTKETAWPPRYAARRIAWHALDHAWEIEDRIPRSS